LRRALACLLLALPLAGGPPPKTRERIRVPVWTAQGEALDRKGFAARVDGEPARIADSQGPADDLMVLVVFDLTGDLRLIEVAKQAAVEAIRALPAKAAVGLLRAQDGMHVVLDPTMDREAADRAIAALPTSGKAAFLDTVEDVSRIADAVLSKARLRTAVIYLTDSSIYNYREDYTNPVINTSDSHDMSRRFGAGLINEKISALDLRLAAFQSPLFVVHLAYLNDGLEQAYQAGVLQLAASSGGSAAFCQTSADIPEAVAAAFTRAASLYTLDLDVPPKSGRVLQVQVEHEGATLTYRGRFSTSAR
jgi:hypothetical protein